MDNDEINARMAARILRIAALNGGREAPPPPPPPVENNDEPYEVFLDPVFIRILAWLTFACIIWIMAEALKLYGPQANQDGGYGGEGGSGS